MIGCTTSTVGDRIKNASKGHSYLFSEVEVVLILRRYNIVPEDLEEQIHQFFNSQRLNVEIYDKNNTLYRPREWFVVPPEPTLFIGCLNVRHWADTTDAVRRC